MAQFSGLNLSGSSNAEIADALIALNRSLDYQMTHLGSDNIQEIGGWQIGPTQLTSKDFDVGMSTDDSQAENIRFWAGGPSDTAAFRVYDTGRVVMSNGVIEWGEGNVLAPGYEDIGGIKPPSNADNTETALPATLGINFTRIGPDYIYTGTVNANKINVGTLTGFTIQTGFGVQRMVMQPDGLRSYDQNGTKRIAIENVGSFGYHELRFFGQSGSAQGTISGTDGYLNIYGNTNTIIGGGGGLYIDASTPFVDFQNRPIRNAGVTARFG